MNKAAQQLGRLARGKPKHFSRTELMIRTERIRAYNRAKRAAKNTVESQVVEAQHSKV
jgi:hypothetical protein